MVDKLFQNTTNRWRVASKVFIDRHGKPINYGSVRSMNAQIANADRNRPKRYTELMQAIDI